MQAAETTPPAAPNTRWKVTTIGDAVTRQPSEVHLHPDADQREHELSPSCWCKPNEDDGSEGPNEVPLWVHNNLDHREHYENLSGPTQ